MTVENSIGIKLKPKLAEIQQFFFVTKKRFYMKVDVKKNR